jgi:hypothetical protein
MNESSQQSESPLETSDLRYLDPKRLRFLQRCATLHLTVEERITYLDVKIIRLFPLDDPERYLRIQSNDNEEIGILEEIAGLSTDNKQLVMDDLDRRYLLPIVKRVVHVKESFGTVDLGVETSHGFRTFTMRNLRENVVQASPNRYLLSDIDGNRYEVSNLDQLDAISRAYLWRYL